LRVENDYSPRNSAFAWGGAGQLSVRIGKGRATQRSGGVHSRTSAFAWGGVAQLSVRLGWGAGSTAKVLLGGPGPTAWGTEGLGVRVGWTGGVDKYPGGERWRAEGDPQAGWG